ncbi:putative phage abortive infection protein [Paenibacillus pabuli]|uniref:Phage abortive infection protein n=1 Tax=Paenibacillus pabuli TaxID=1472 RepID=A0ABX9BBG3_9BACL|nr:putative phage abortive infection protein [Paenibacillus pabuli]RAI84432.1 putative phage abortive infection protein [Paenibacillus pabuli]
MEEKRKYKLYQLLIIVASIIGVWGFINPILIGWIFKDKEGYGTYKEFGPVGDWIGGTSTPIITLASFIILLAAFLAQKEELQATRDEMNLTRKEFKEQNKTLARQRFENTFFHMVSLHHSIVNSIERTETESHSVSYTESQYTSKIIRGRAYISNIARPLVSSKWSDVSQLWSLKQQYNNIYQENQSELGHYFRNLYHIIKLIDESAELENDSDCELEERKKYIRIIRAQLSTDELLLLLYNSLTDEGSKFHTLIIKYKLLNNLSVKLVPKALRDVFVSMKQE